jgi:hypothetical protein
MEEMMTSIDGWTLAFFAFSFAMVMLTGVVFRALKLEDPDLWKSLGAPSLLQVDAQANIYKFWSWMFGHRQGAHNLSPVTLRLVLLLRIGTVLFLVAFAAMTFRVFLGQR